MKLKLIVLAMMLIWPLSSLAIEAHNNNYITLAGDQTVNSNYYAAGNKIEIFGTVNGDVFAVGNDIVIDSSNINGDIFAAGNTISVKGKINGSLRLIGQKLVIDAEVTRNILAAGQNLDINKDAKIQGHVTFAGQLASIYGTVGGRLESALENLRLNGQIAGDADVYLGSKDKKLANIDLASGAKINGHLKYWSSQNLNLDQTKVGQGIEHQTITQAVKHQTKKGFGLFGWLWEFLSMLVIALLWWRWHNKFFYQAYDVFQKNKGKSLLWGFLSLIALPILIVLLMITVIGIPLALILLASWLIALCLAKILAAWILIRFVQQAWWKKYHGKDWALLILGILLMSLLAKVPVIGWLICFVFYLWAWGAIIHYFYNKK